ncbi:RAMP superfamily CRISPR-associated protein [Actinomadura atramentaria]|uniref:RAMP superfamily CRISPR-associated protein n=1 Tax=Actinomadura atramentaria TaxID=1990 RepID=UPI000361C151|nr:RAMP superfamily CRISPR-associated protein [Actinomadura atramentaria]
MTGRRGRPLDLRLRVRGWLAVRSPLAVGGIAADPADALPVALDGQGRVHVPGTSLAGALRAWTRGRGDDPVELWGDAEDVGASRIVVRDGIVASSFAVDADGIPTEPVDAAALPVRYGVAIDRETGAAASEALYARTVVPPGNYVRFELDVECGRATADRDRARLRALLDALAAERIRLGAASGTGFGTVSLLRTPLDVEEHDFTSADGLIAFLRGEVRAADLDVAADPALPPRREELTVTVAWTPTAPVMTRAPGDGAMVGALPLVTDVAGDRVALVLPGSSVKGALRSRAELIERTLRGDAGVAAALFGPWRDADARRGAVAVAECVSRTTVPADVWDAVVNGDDGPDAPVLPAGVRDRLAQAGLDRADHVAIDRWTGGAARGRLFSVLEPHGVAWEPIRLAVDLTRLGADADRAVALLLVVLRDLAGGRVPLGGRTGRGFGDVAVESVDLRGGRWPDGATLPDALATPALRAAWTAYLEEEA